MFNGNRAGYFNEFDARASAETHELEMYEPVIPVADVRLVCARLSERAVTDFDNLANMTKLDESRLSEALARGYDLDVVKISLATGAVGYLLAGTGASREAALTKAEKEKPVERISIVEVVMETVQTESRSAERKLLGEWSKELEEIRAEQVSLKLREGALTVAFDSLRILLDLGAVPPVDDGQVSFAGVETATAAIRHLARVGHGLTNREITEALQERGWSTTSANEVDAVRKALATNARRPDSRLCLVKDRWTLKEWQN